MDDSTSEVLAAIQQQLREAGLDVELPDLSAVDPAQCKIICMPAGLSTTIRQMAREPRSNVMMVRVDDETLRQLDAWIETGAVASRSEAAALFLREGLQIRADELKELEDALDDVERAKARLRAKARTVLRQDAVDADDHREDES